MAGQVPVLLSADALLVAHLLDRIALTRDPGLVTFDIMSGKEDTIARHDLSRLQKRYVANNDVLRNS